MRQYVSRIRYLYGYLEPDSFSRYYVVHHALHRTTYLEYIRYSRRVKISWMSSLFVLYEYGVLRKCVCSTIIYSYPTLYINIQQPGLQSASLASLVRKTVRFLDQYTSTRTVPTTKLSRRQFITTTLPYFQDSSSITGKLNSMNIKREFSHVFCRCICSVRSFFLPSFELVVVDFLLRSFFRGGFFFLFDHV